MICGTILVVAGLGYICLGTLALVALCRANGHGEDVFVRACSRCGQRLLNAEKVRGFCCHCASIPPRHRAGREVEAIGEQSP